MSKPFGKGKTADESSTAVAVKPEVSSIVKIEKELEPLKKLIANIKIESDEDRDKAHKMRSDLKAVKKIIKEYTEDFIDPLKRKAKRLKDGIDPLSSKIEELDGIVARANSAWDTKQLQAKRKEQEEANALQEKEKEEAVEKVVEAKKEGRKVPVEVYQKLVEPVVVVGSAKIKGDGATSSTKLVIEWFILLLDGTEWNRKERLQVASISGYSAQQAPLLCVDVVAINQKFNPNEPNGGLPHWIKVREVSKETIR